MQAIERVDSGPDYMRGFSSATDYYMAQACRHAAAQGALEQTFRAACKAGRVSASTAKWAPAHYPTLGDVMNCALDFSNGPTHDDAMQLILDAANGHDVCAKAHTLLGRMAAKWADHYTEQA